MCSSDFVFRKYKQDSAFWVGAVLQLAKTGPLIAKNFPLLRTNLHILTAPGMSLELANFEAWEKNFTRLSEAQTRIKITNQMIIDFNILEWKSGKNFIS